jgi:hypothetical protein
MFLIYVDESGDTGIPSSGLHGSPTNYYVLSGIVIHELRWKEYLEQIQDFRKRLRKQFGLKLREEFHSGALITRPKGLSRIPKYQRLAMIRMFADELASMKDIRIINIVTDKSHKPSSDYVFEISWKAMIQRLENTISYHNFPGPKNPDDCAMVFPDNTDNKALIQLMRKLRHYNPVPNQFQYGGGYRNLVIRYVIEDGNFRDSRNSYFVQAADLAAYLLYQFHVPCSYIRQKGAKNYFKRLDPVLCKVASRTDPLGIVYL